MTVIYTPFMYHKWLTVDILSANIDLLNSTFPSEFIDLIDTRRQQHINIRRIPSISAIVIIF